MIDKTRDAFEAWYAKFYHPFALNDKENGCYLNSNARVAWEAWQAATLAERERCALVCEQHMQMYNDALNEPKLSGIELSTLASMKLASRCCAAFIRKGGAS